jgi:carbon monoxide dehydrogenase subunit G
MEIRNKAHVAAPVEHVWSSLAAIDQIATCIPGASVTGHPADDRYTGEVRVKVGPLGLTLGGEVVVEELDAVAHVMRLQMSARDRRGLGQVSASVTITLEGDADSTDLEIWTDATLQGPVAQFGRQGVVEAVSGRVLADFTRCLEERLGSSATA